MSLLSHSRERMELICDIDDDSIGISTILIGADKLPKIQFEDRNVSEAIRTEQTEIDSFIVSSIQRLLGQLDAQSKAYISAVHVVFHSPYISSSVEIDVEEQKVPVRVTHARLSSLIARSAPEPSEKTTLVEGIPMRVRLNGYEFADPFEKDARSIHVETYYGVVGTDTIHRVGDALRVAGVGAPIIPHTWPYAMFSSLTSIVQHERRFMIVDVGIHRTGIIFVDAGVIQSVQEIGTGVSVLWEMIGKTASVDPHEAATMVRMFRDGKLDGGRHDSVAGALDDFRAIWSSQFADTIQMTSRRFLVPPHIYTIGDDAVHAYLGESIVGGGLNHVTLNNKPFVVNHVTCDLVSHFVQCRDVMLGLETLFVYNIK